jgi:hypothetical protein
MPTWTNRKTKHIYSDAASGWAGWALAHPEFGSSINPIKTRGADYAHHITASPSGFENPAASLYYIQGIWLVPNGHTLAGLAIKALHPATMATFQIS